MTIRLKKKKNSRKTRLGKSSLSTKYVDEFINNVKEKLNVFDIGFLTPYKKKLDELDPTVIADITKDLRVPNLVIKSALDELWNHHWMLGQKDVIQDEQKKVKFGYSDHRFIEFATDTNQDITTQTASSAEIDREQLVEINKQVKRTQTRLKEELRKKQQYQNKQIIEGNKAQLTRLSSKLDQYLGSITDRKPEQRPQRFKSIEVRIRDLQETIRTMELQIEAATQTTTEESQRNRIDILNSSEFGTVYQNRRTLLLGSNYAQDHKASIITSIKKYFSNTDSVRPNTRESSLFRNLTKYTLTPREKERQEDNKRILSQKVILSDQDGTAFDNGGRSMDLKSFISNLGTSDKSIQDYINSKPKTALDRELRELTTKTNKSPLFKDLTDRLIKGLDPYIANVPKPYYQPKKVKSYSETIEPIIKEILTLEKKPIKRRGEFLKGFYDEKAKEYKTVEELKEGQVNTLNLNRIKRIAETEISVAYNLGRLKKLQELGYKQVIITNEAENITNRNRALSEFQGNDIQAISRVYRAKNSEDYLPILCAYCVSRDGEVVDINTLYGTTQKGTDAKVPTRYDIFDPATKKSYSFAPPFHVSCWCYFVGVDDPNARGTTSNNLPSISDGLILSGVGLLSVASAYLAFGRLGKNRINIPQAVQQAKERIQQTAENIGTAIQNVGTNIGNAVDELLGRPKVNIPLKRLEEVKAAIKVSDEAFDAVQTETNQLLKIPVNFAPKTSAQVESVEEVVLNSVDEIVSDTAYPTLNNAPKTFNTVIQEIPDYVQSLQPIIKAREEYYRLRNILYDTTIALETRQALYPQYLSSRTNYDSLITRHLNNTRDLKNTVNSMQSQISVDANRQLLANRNNLPSTLTLDEALNNVRSRKALTFTDTQLKAIRDNLAIERKGLRDKIGVESKVLDSALDGIDTQQKSVDIKSSVEDTTQLNTFYTPKPKTLNKVVSEISSIKKELNNISKTKDTIRSLSTSRINSNSTIDRQLLIDTQQTYINKVLEQQKVISKELAKLPSDTDKLDNFVNLYRSEILDKVENSYPYSRNVWSSKELTDLKNQYTKASDIVTTRNTYQSYLDETEDMLSKLSNFETTIVDNTIKFSKYSDGIIIDRGVLKKISKLPSIDNIVFNK